MDKDTNHNTERQPGTEPTMSTSNGNLESKENTPSHQPKIKMTGDTLTISVNDKNGFLSVEVPSDDGNGKSGAESGVKSGPESEVKFGVEPDHWDKGWAWFVVIGASICNLIVFGSLRSAGIILNEVTARYDASPIAGSLVIIINVSCTIVWTPVASHLTNKIPCRYLVMGGGMLISAGLMTAAFGDTLPVAYVGLGVLCGSGGGFVLSPSYIVINQYFKEKRSKAFAISTAGMGIGALSFAPILAYWFNVYGYTGALFLNAGLFLNLQVAGMLMRPPPTGTVVPDTETETESETKTETETTPLIKSKPKPSKLKLLKNPTFLLYMFNIICTTLPQFLTFVPAYALELGISTGYSSILISCNGFTDIAGRLGSGFFFDRVVHGRKRVYHSIIGVVAGFSVAMVGYIPSEISLLVGIFLVGLFEGIFSAQRTVVPFEFVDPEDMSNAVGLIIFAECIGTILGPLMQGAVKGLTGSYAMGYAIGGSLFAVSSFIMLCEFCVRTAIWGITH